MSSNRGCFLEKSPTIENASYTRLDESSMNLKHDLFLGRVSNHPPYFLHEDESRVICPTDTWSYRQICINGTTPIWAQLFTPSYLAHAGTLCQTLTLTKNICQKRFKNKSLVTIVFPFSFLRLKILQKKQTLTSYSVRYNSFHVLGRISTRIGKQYSTNTDYIRENGTVRQMNDPLLVKFNDPKQFTTLNRG